MNTTIKMKLCAGVGCTNQFKPFLSTQKYCSAACTYQNQKKGGNRKRPGNIRRFSTKRQALNAEYTKITKSFLSKHENSRCPVTCSKSTEVHHKMGRVGYADDWARMKNIPLLIDVRHFLGVSRAGHKQIEENPEWAKVMGYSLSRLASYGGGE